MKRAKTKGVPKTEMYLAKLLQNAWSRGLKGARGAPYRNKSGTGLWVGYATGVPPEGAVSCCALGAAMLEKDTWSAEKSYLAGLMFGNDSDFVDTDAEFVGYSFKVAMED